MTENVDVKPKISIRVAHEGRSITIKVRAITPFKKIFDAAEAQFGVQPGTFKFTFEGNRILADQTPAELEMEDEDVIDAHLQQIGGSY
ncbi:ubiquitin-related domain-containing protein [Irpex rosettiformis]|uniref:Ubiquitin-related domain-containing protein n=1 Tax=Irpex rosettiformis TaxID=378272 RepID=A0ACB8TRC3_9APHY|nr:ubiquitin-related domain-containing protein [Irpex rosettiformis]